MTGTRGMIQVDRASVWVVIVVSCTARWNTPIKRSLWMGKQGACGS